MKIKNIIKILMVTVLLYIVLNMICIQFSNAAIEIKPGTTVQTNISINDSFQYCYDMRHPTSSLGNNSLDPHVAKATDWGITAYLGLSGYGAVKSASGPQITIGESNYSTTTGNASGVMNFGRTITQVAGYAENSTSNANEGCRTKLYLPEYSRYVDVIGENTVLGTRGMAYAETSGWYNSSQEFLRSNDALDTRSGVIGYTNWYGQGTAIDNQTYRPVIWN